MTITLQITPDTGSYEYVPGTGFVSGPSQKGPLDPENPDSEPVITLEGAIPPSSSAAWTGLWELEGMPTDSEVEVTAIISNGLSESETKTFVVE